MKPNQPLARSHLYTIRLWPEELGDGVWEWRGMVKYVASGEEHYFRDWGALKELMVRMIDSFIPLLETTVGKPGGER